MTRADLVGWTLAETAFVLLFAIVAAVLPSYEHTLTKNKQLEEDQNRTLKQNLPLARQVLDLRAQNESLKATIEESTKHLRSKARPPCSELDKSKGYLFTATITSANSFEVNGQVYTAEQLISHFAEPISEAEKLDCVEQVRLYFRSGLTADEFQSARNRIELYFYPKVISSVR
jgi:hypothetical protein